MDDAEIDPAAIDDGVLLPNCDIVLDGHKLFLVYNRYIESFNIGIDLYHRDDDTGVVELYTHVTVNHDKYFDILTDDTILVRDWGVNKDLPQALFDAGVIGGKPQIIGPNLYAAYPLIKKPAKFKSKKDFLVDKKLTYE